MVQMRLRSPSMEQFNSSRVSRKCRSRLLIERNPRVDRNYEVNPFIRMDAKRHLSSEGRYKIVSFVLLLWLHFCRGAEDGSVYTAFLYLSKFGYTDPNRYEKASLITQDSMEQDIKDFQRFASLSQTGILDEMTLKMMAMPRCGVKDKVGRGSDARKKRYALQGSRWKVKELFYRVGNGPTKWSMPDTQEVFKNAFKVWSDVVDIDFKEVDDTATKIHLDIEFARGKHGDGDPFDGVGGTLAHAYFPIYGGDAHFDDAEIWTKDTYQGTNLFQVVVHELGHSLGLSHSEDPNALMAPFYRGYQPNFVLHADDIRGIQSLYGPKATKTPSTTKPDTKKAASLCEDPSINAVVRIANKMDLAFKGKYYWELLEDGVSTDSPREIAADFAGLPDNIDCAYSRDEKTYFFKGDKLWKFVNFDPVAGYPKLISDEYIGIPNDLDCCFIWSGNDKLYFFKGSQYWKYDMKMTPPISGKYPKKVSYWGLPDQIDAAYVYYANGRTYFFKDGKYWRFNDGKFRVDIDSKAPYPRSTQEWWFGCNS